jgi:multicomponent Na+:H+ antiporter subunit A
MLIAVLIGFGAALLAPLAQRRLKQRSGWLIALLPIGLFLYFGSQLPYATEAQSVTTPWVPALGVNLSFRADGLSLLFALLISGIGALVVIYAGDYLKGHAQLGRFYAWLLMFMSAMLGVVLADNVLLLFVFWELTSFSSFMLIGFNHEDGQSRGAALQALLVTSSGGLAMLAGLVMLGLIGGTFELSVLLTRGAALQASPWYAPALVLVVRLISFLT